eukprot:4041853-Ditylum_brightwellii.AAC.1
MQKAKEFCKQMEKRAIVKSSMRHILEKRQEREMRTETGTLLKSFQQCESFSVATLKRKVLTKLKATAKQNEMAEKKQTARKAIVMPLMK